MPPPLTPSELEARILRLAWSRGLLAEAPGAVEGSVGGDGGAFGPRIQALLDRGLLSRELVDSLAWEVERGWAGGEGPATAIADAWTVLAPEDGEAGAPPRPVEELAWERYQGLEFLAAGGQARIYRAFDPRLHRWVALKFLKEGVRATQDHILREARAQAKVEHPHVCRVYEVAEVEGVPYISMQLVEGETFHHALDRLDLRRKVEIVRDVAEGIHAAHRIGLLHLDLKPGNILLEHREGGRPHALVADFGLGRLEGDPDDGLALGTPPYASPEQVAGQGGLDRRCDIYALGVTLYTAVSGQWPFRGSSQTELLEQISGELPRPLREVDPAQSRDLEAVLAKAMARRPADRYATALAFAEDLQRFLDGEPVEARRGSAGYGLRKWIARRRALAAGAAFALAGVALTSVLLGLQVRRVRAEAAYVQEFSREVERIEALVRYMRMQPLHDIRPELAVIHGRMDRLRERIGSGGGPALAPGHHALGRGLYVLGRWEEARAELGKAWNLGLRTPELELDLGRVLASLYVSRRYGIGFVVDAATRRRQEAELARDFGRPAAEHLRRGRAGDPAGAAYVEALLAFCEDRPEEGRAKAREALATAPWMAEALQLQAFIDIAGMDGAAPGGRPGQEDDGPLAAALRLAPSDPRLYYLEASRWWNLAKAQAAREPLAQFPTLARGLDYVEQGLRLDPGAGDLLQQKARFLYLLAQESGRLGRPGAQAHIEGARTAADAAVAADPGAMNAWRTRASVYGTLAEQKLQRGEPAGSEVEEGLRSMQRALDAGTPRTSGLRYVAWLLSVRAEDARAQGGDPRPALGEAIRLFEEVLAADPDEAYTLESLASLQGDLAQWDLEEGRAGEALLQQALGHIARRTARDPEDPGPRAVRVRLLVLSARAARLQGRDGRPALAEAEAEAQALLRMPGRIALHGVEAARVPAEAAAQAALGGGNPSAAFGLARRRLAQARALQAGLPALDLAQAELSLAEAAWRRRAGLPSGAAVQEGLAACGRLLAKGGGPRLARALRGALLAQGRPASRWPDELRDLLAADPHLRAKLAPYLDPGAP